MGNAAAAQKYSMSHRSDGSSACRYSRPAMTNEPDSRRSEGDRDLGGVDGGIVMRKVEGEEGGSDGGVGYTSFSLVPDSRFLVVSCTGDEGLEPETCGAVGARKLDGPPSSCGAAAVQLVGIRRPLAEPPTGAGRPPSDAPP